MYIYIYMMCLKSRECANAVTFRSEGSEFCIMRGNRMTEGPCNMKIVQSRLLSSFQAISVIPEWRLGQIWPGRRRSYREIKESFDRSTVAKSTSGPRPFHVFRLISDYYPPETRACLFHSESSAGRDPRWLASCRE